MTYDYIQDDGHGWLKVPLQETNNLKISSFSYKDKTHAYLEEDCDMAVFCKSKGWTKWLDIEPNINDVIHRGSSTIRNMERF